MQENRDISITECAKKHASMTTFGRFNNSPKAKINRNEYQDALEITYLIGSTNALKDILVLAKDKNYQDIDELIGDIQLLLKDAWDGCCKNKLGRNIFRKMELEDIIQNKSVENFVHRKLQ